MKTFLFAATLALAQFAAAEVRYFNQVEFSTSSSQIKLVDAQYALIPTKTAVHAIPGCNPNLDATPICDQTIVVESEAVIQVNISYEDSTFSTDGNTPNYTSVILPLSAFSAEDVAALKAVYPAWKHPFSNVARKFAKNKLVLTVVKANRGASIVDVRNSRICPVGENGETQVGCIENLAYKQVQSPVLVATVTAK